MDTLPETPQDISGNLMLDIRAEYVVIQCRYDPECKAYYAYSLEDAMALYEKTVEEQGGTWRIAICLR